ncbi:V-type ATP synthase subunit D [candidate division WOR-3 bacterium]|nr:V-type ATP synthase subunit D [candidate division WOR-3 bacterium]MCK4528338.1 V-type ATP synthase subunit D [candidate division WOR-3 bacterium]
MNVNPTRMELLRLKKRTTLAVRGHKLLKQKQDELLRIIQEIISKLSNLRKEIEEELLKALKKFFLARAYQDKKSFEASFLLLDTDIELSMGWKKVMNVPLPEYKKSLQGELISYGFANTSPTLDEALKNLMVVFDRLIELAEMEKRIALLAEEMKKTRRRVNALEYILIPELKAAVRYINMKLSEREREVNSRLMRIKDVIRG